VLTKGDADQSSDGSPFLPRFDLALVLTDTYARLHKTQPPNAAPITISPYIISILHNALFANAADQVRTKCSIDASSYKSAIMAQSRIQSKRGYKTRTFSS
jgi:hypothetical protein